MNGLRQRRGLALWKPQAAADERRDGRLMGFAKQNPDGKVPAEHCMLIIMLGLSFISISQPSDCNCIGSQSLLVALMILVYAVCWWCHYFNTKNTHPSIHSIYKLPLYKWLSLEHHHRPHRKKKSLPTTTTAAAITIRHQRRRRLYAKFSSYPSHLKLLTTRLIYTLFYHTSVNLTKL